MPSSENLEVKICNKAELCGELGVSTSWAQTTEEINGICKEVVKKEITPGRDIFIIGQNDSYLDEEFI